MFMIRPCQPGALLAALLLPSAALASDATLNSQLTTSILTTLGMLAVVIACFLGLIWLTRKLQNSSWQSHRSLQIIESLPVGRHERISIVKVGNQYQILGITAQQITLLDTLDHLDTDAHMKTSQTDDKNQAWHWAQQFLQNKAR